MTVCIISSSLNAEWSFKCKYGIKSAWGFFDISPAVIFGSYKQSHVVCMSWICFGKMNLCIWCQGKPFEHERERMWWGRVTQKVCVCVCVVVDGVFFFAELFGQNIKTAEQRDSSFCLHHISHEHARTHTHGPRSTQNHTNAANHSSIFYARMRKTLATLCKSQLMCAREEKGGWAAGEHKSGGSEWESGSRGAR